MKRWILAAALAVVTSLLAIVGHAASLNVVAGVLQTQTSAVEIDIPDASVEVEFTAYRRTGNNVHAYPAESVLPVGTWYQVSWVSDGDVVVCPADTLPSDKTLRAPGIHQATEDGDFGFCVSNSPGTVTITVVPEPASEQGQ